MSAAVKGSTPDNPLPSSPCTVFLPLKRVYTFTQPVPRVHQTLTPALPCYDVCLVALSDLRTDARSYNIAMALAHSGRKVCVLTPNWSNGAQFEGLDLFTVECPTEGRLLRKWMRFSSEAEKMGTVFSARSYWAEDLWSLRAAAALAKRQKARLLYDSREIYSALGPLHRRPLMQSVVAFMERHYVRNVDRIIVSGDWDAEYIRQHLKRREKPTVVMNVPAYTEPKASKALHERFGIPHDSQIVVYQGAVLEGRGIEVMMRCLPSLPKLHLCVIGDGPQLGAMQSLAQSMQLHERVHFLGSIPNHELLAWTASADVGLCFVEPISFSYRLALPNKLFEYAMAGIPALVSDLPAMRTVIERFPFGELVATDANIEQLVASLTALLNNPAVYRAQALAAAKVYNREAQQQVVADLASELERL